MLSLRKPQVLDVPKYADIVKSRRKPIKGRLRRVRPQVTTAYSEYENLLASPLDISRISITGVKKDSLIDTYGSRCKPIIELKDEIKGITKEKFLLCPYCKINEPNSIDHYFPKEKFPEYSFYSPNMIHVCSVCNTDYKREKVVVNNNRIFIHSYFDLLPDIDLISVDIKIKNGRINIEYSCIHDENNVEICALFLNHFNALNLNKRYSIQASRVLGGLRKILSRFYVNNNTETIINELKREAHSARIKWGYNSWEVILYDHLVDNDEYCNQGFLFPCEKID